MAPKDFKNAMTRQRSATPPPVATPANPGVPRRLGVVGNEIPNAIREELERTAAEIPVREVSLEQLQDNPFQHLARTQLDPVALSELSDSIRSNGFFGALLARRRRGALDIYELAFGHRRREAARIVGLKSVPVKIIDLSDQQMARIMASENFSREDLLPLGEANVVGFLYTQQNLTVEQIAEIVGKKRGWVQPRLALYEAPPDVKAMVEAKPESFSHARLLGRVKDAALRANLIREVLQNNLTLEQLGYTMEQLKDGKLALLPDIDKKITSDTADANRYKNHDASRESTNPTTNARIQRLESLNRLDKAASRFERLASEVDYKLNKEEQTLLQDILERLNALAAR